MHRRHFLSLNFAWLAGLGGANANGDPVIQQAISRGKQFLVDLLDPELDLLPEFRGSKTYWLFHDNYLAAQVLKKSHPAVAAKIDAALKREKVTASGKIEILFGDNPKLSATNQYELIDVRKVKEKVIKTERMTEKKLEGWMEYADLWLIDSMRSKMCYLEPGADLENAFAFWDGKGFMDQAARKHKQYATYKLALACLAIQNYRRRPFESKLQELQPMLLNLQDASGGWITDYNANLKPLGKANVETTCLCILALEGMLASG